MDPYIFELRVPVACTLSYGAEHRKEISCVPGDLVRVPIVPDDVFSSVIEIYNVMPYEESKEV